MYGFYYKAAGAKASSSRVRVVVEVDMADTAPPESASPAGGATEWELVEPAPRTLSAAECSRLAFLPEWIVG